ncbi:MAG: CHAT domain-containing protein [Oscillatoria sp. SIO1A7]|nr:CHAT domain-containing protein [Oscillatoria sp. SIO1A7]
MPHKALGRYIELGLLTLALVTVLDPSSARGSETRSENREPRHQLERALIARDNSARDNSARDNSARDNSARDNINGRSLLKKGRTQAESGNFSQAAAIWKEALALSRQEGDLLGEAISSSYLSYAYLQLGQLELGRATIQESLGALQEASDQPGALIVKAGALNTQGNIQLAIGETQAALESWQDAEEAYELAGDELGKLGAQINQAQALQALGLYRRSRSQLERALSQLQSQPDSLVKATGLRSLGVALQAIGNLERSSEVLQQSLLVSQKLSSELSTSAVLYDLGNTASQQKDMEAAIEYYRQAATMAPGLLEKTEARIGQINSYLELKKWEDAQALLPEIERNLASLPASRMSVYARVNLAESMIKLEAGIKDSAKKLGSEASIIESAAELLAVGAQQAQDLKDARAESYALGQLGKLYKVSSQLKEAQKLTEKALLIAVGIEANEIAARWQGQLGGILQEQSDREGAIVAYTEAVNNFSALRRDLVAIDSEVQFSFKESVEPSYRELVSLLLESEPSQDNLRQAREVIEALQLAELDNFFREACLDTKPQQIDQIDRKAAVIYPIILSDRIEVIISIPGQPLRNYKTLLPKAEIEKKLKRSRQALSLSFPKNRRFELYETLYDWLIRPAEAELAASGIETLVFVLDGSLRNLPMPALYDGERYLVEKYGIALTPGLQLLAPRPIDDSRLATVMAGLSEARQGFSALPGVESEVDKITTKVESNKVLLNEQFTNNSLQNAVSRTNSPVLHLATHGQFSSNRDETFILAWDEKIKIEDLEEMLGIREQNRFSPIELLVLSACQTAKGDNRAVLGLAGLAVKTGARSTMASLWAVRDDSTADLMTEFYNQLALSGTGKAEAMRQAQISLLNQPKYQHPFFWAAFVLVGNWL